MRLSFEESVIDADVAELCVGGMLLHPQVICTPWRPWCARPMDIIGTCPVWTFWHSSEITSCMHMAWRSAALQCQIQIGRFCNVCWNVP